MKMILQPIWMILNLPTASPRSRLPSITLESLRCSPQREAGTWMWTKEVSTKEEEEEEEEEEE